MNMSDVERDTAAKVIERNVQLAQEPKLLPGREDAWVVVVPKGADEPRQAGGSEVRIITQREVDRLNEKDRAEGAYQVGDVRSFVEYVQRHATPASTVWLDPHARTVVAVLDDHPATAAGELPDEVPLGGRGWHRVTLTLEHTPEWNRWVGNDGRLLGQESFAELVEDSITVIAEPPAADLLELAQTLQGTTTATWRSGHRLQDGSIQLRYDEDVQATAGRDGNTVIPHHFTLVLEPFFGEAPVSVEARFRYRLNGGDVKLGYRLDNIERVERNALDVIADRIREQLGTVPVLTGTPHGE
jgi:uncharacterized protein YfdQ (DUF2303 family)